ncbi:MAG: hypothetical protein J0I09_07865 [Sphingobacteriia bacterium]|nr:hypothetical protein [Sphingobacteriia bacterium]
MRNPFLIAGLILIAFGLLNSCHSIERKAALQIPGVYVHAFDQEYARGNDTLFITVLTDEAVTYKVEHHITYLPVRDGKLQSVKNVSEAWTALYHTDTRQLVEQRKGKVFSFSPAGDCLYIGASKFDKIR